jgi:hypothetical protein
MANKLGNRFTIAASNASRPALRNPKYLHKYFLYGRATNSTSWKNTYICAQCIEMYK